MTTELPVSCNRDCGGDCPLVARVENGRVTSIRNNPQVPSTMKGCVKGMRFADIQYHPDRLRKPLVAGEGKGAGPAGSNLFREASWDEALDLVAEKMTRFRDTHAPESLLLAGGFGACRGALHNTNALISRFLSGWGGYTVTTGGYSAAAESHALPFVFGTKYYGMDPENLDESRLVLLWGANVMEARFGCELPTFLRGVKKRGVPIYSVEPRRSASCRELDSTWIPLYPGTDTVLMAAVLYELFDMGAADRDFLDRYTVGARELEAYISGDTDGVPKTPAWASPLCGTPVALITELAAVYGKTHPAALIPGLSIQRALGGEDAARMAVCLQAVTGNVGIPGGSTGGYVPRLPVARCGKIPETIAPYGREPVIRKLPVSLWPDAVLHGKEGGKTARYTPLDLRAAYVAGANYLNQAPHISKSVEAFRSLEFAICHEIFLTPTARYSDVVLPVTTWLEREDILFSVGDSLHYSHRVVEGEGVKNDYEIFRLLADRLGFGEAFSGPCRDDDIRKEEAHWIEWCLERSEVEDTETFRRTGIYLTERKRRGLARNALSDFREDPEAHGLDTPSGRMELASELYARQKAAAVPPERAPDTPWPDHPVCHAEASPEGYPLRMITPHTLYRINSQYTNVPWFLEKEPQILTIHVDDAASRGIAEGDMVVVYSGDTEATMEIGVKLSTEILAGVVSAPQGMNFTLIDNNDNRENDDNGGNGGNGGAPIQEIAGSVNILVTDRPTYPSAGIRTHSICVEVTGKPVKAR